MGILKDTRYTARLWFCVVAVLLLSGCVGTPVTFPEADNNRIGRSHGRAISAGSCGFQLLLLIPININNRAERAYAELRETAGSDVIADIQVREKWFYGFVGTGYCTQLVARAYRPQPAPTSP